MQFGLFCSTLTFLEMLNKPAQKLQKFFWEVWWLYFWEELLSETFPINQEPQDNSSAKIKEDLYTLRIYIRINRQILS